MNNNIRQTPRVTRKLIANDALLVFFQNGYFGPGENSENITDEMPYLMAGYLDFTGLMTLFKLYAHYNNLYQGNLIISDDFMNYCFGEQYPANYYIFRNMLGENERLDMNTAVDSGLISGPLNSYQVLGELLPEFTSRNLDNQILIQIIELNSEIRDVEENIGEGIRSDNNKLVIARKNTRNFMSNSGVQPPNGYGMDKIRRILQGWRTKNARFIGTSY